MVADKREFVRLDVGYLDNPKIADALDASPVAVLAHIASMTYCRQHRTDGLFAVNRILRKVGATADDARVLIDLGLWIDLGGGKAELHDYLKHQESAAQIARLSEAGRKGAASRWANKRNADRSTNRNADDGTSHSDHVGARSGAAGRGKGATALTRDNAHRGGANRNADRYAEERRGEERRKEAAAAPVRDADRIEAQDAGQHPEFDPKKLLASAGLAQHEVRDFLVDLKANRTRNTTALINALHRDGKLPARIAEWRTERDLATEAASRPAPSKPNRAQEGMELARRLAAEEGDPNVIPLRQIEGA